ARPSLDSVRRCRRERPLLRRGARGARRRESDGFRRGGGLRHGRPTFWIAPRTDEIPNRQSHIAFVAPDRAAVRAFVAAAVAQGAEVLHEPRAWPEYHPNYYGGFVRDPDGNNVEAVCHLPE